MPQGIGDDFSAHLAKVRKGVKGISVVKKRTRRLDSRAAIYWRAVFTAAPSFEIAQNLDGPADDDGALIYALDFNIKPPDDF